MSFSKRAMTRLLPLVAIAILASSLPGAQALAQDEPGSRLVDAITADDPADGGRLELDSVSDFSVEGGTAVLEPDSEQEESFTYEGIDEETNELIGLERTDPKNHEEESFVRADSEEAPEDSQSPSPTETQASPSPTGDPSPSPSSYSVPPTPAATPDAEPTPGEDSTPTPEPSPSATSSPAVQPSPIAEPISDVDAPMAQSPATTQSVGPDPMSVATLIWFDNIYLAGPGGCGYVGFTAYNVPFTTGVVGSPSWTAVIASSAGSRVVTGTVDSGGRGYIYDCSVFGATTYTVSMVAAEASAVRQQDGVGGAPPVPCSSSSNACDPEEIADNQVDLLTQSSHCSVTAQNATFSPPDEIHGYGLMSCNHQHAITTEENCIITTGTDGVWVVLPGSCNRETVQNGWDAGYSTKGDCIAGSTKKYRVRARGKAKNADGEVIHKDSDRSDSSTTVTCPGVL